MPSTIKKLEDKGLIRPPSWLSSNIHFETLMGSVAYGVNSDTSDMDIYGWAIPPKDMVFPHLSGEIMGFGRQKKRFEQFQEHHIDCPDELGGKGRSYDVQIFGIVKFFQLLMENNPNVVDSIFTPQECVLHITQVGNMVRENRKMFLHKGSFHKFRGYSFSQLHKAESKDPQGKRKEIREQFGWDTKFLYHVARLADEAEQILTFGDIDLRRSKEYLKAIRRGEVTPDDLKKWFSGKERQLEQLYHRESSPVPYSPDEEAIKQLLLDCLEHHYGNLDGCIVMPDIERKTLAEIREVLDRYDRITGASKMLMNSEGCGE